MGDSTLIPEEGNLHEVQTKLWGCQQDLREAKLDLSTIQDRLSHLERKIEEKVAQKVSLIKLEYSSLLAELEDLNKRYNSNNK